VRRIENFNNENDWRNLSRMSANSLRFEIHIAQRKDEGVWGLDQHLVSGKLRSRSRNALIRMLNRNLSDGGSFYSELLEINLGSAYASAEFSS